MLRLTITIKQDDAFYLAARLREMAEKIENGILKGNELHGGGRCEFNIMDETEIQKVASNPVYVGDICPKCHRHSEGGVICVQCDKEERNYPGSLGMPGLF